MKSRHLRIAIGVAVALGSSALAGCAPSTDADADDTVVVWDYYGQSTPLTEAIARFEAANPDITVDHQGFDYDSMQEKFSVAVSSNTGPDLATVDMTWLPDLASKGLLADIGDISGGILNGKPIESQYSAGAYGAMRYDDHTIAALYDFDAYALFYRKDVLDAKGLTVPTTWDELLATSAAMAEDSDGDGKADKYALQLLPDSFHYVQLLLQNGGSVLDSSGGVAFDSDAGIGALEFMNELLTDGGGIYWGPSEGDSSGLPGVKDERIGMFLNGPYMMGVLKDGAAAQSGEWAVAPAPYSKQPGSYLGGTGLVIPTTAKHGSAAWKLAEFLLQPEQQLLVYTEAGAAPATEAALAMPELSATDPYFGEQAPFPVFQDAMATATAFPYVPAWPAIDTALTDAVTAVLIGQASPADALKTAATTAETALNG
ncbi:MAG: sugar ABC transporter substrate-binding protein [Microbacteriaceae bacterium]|nr:sugar ABC transporter substrate-binding protein [Microbacteriaceae bacterium]